MCEQFVAQADEPFAIGELWPFAERLERFGIAGFGWGAAWLSEDGRIEGYRNLQAFRDDAAGRESVGAIRTRCLLVHLRRPSRLSTLTLADTQPFLDPAGRFAFGHNGDLERWRSERRRYIDAGRIHGRADSEVGARWLEDRWPVHAAPEVEPEGAEVGARLLERMHGQFGGQANLAVLAGTGSVAAYAGNTENPIFSFRIGGVAIASTGAYSLDRSLFRLVAPTATNRRLVRLGSSVTLGRSSAPAAAATA